MKNEFFLKYNADKNLPGIDENGVLQELGGGATSWNDLTDKPFGEEMKRVNERDFVSTPSSIYGIFEFQYQQNKAKPVLLEVDGVEYSLTVRERPYYSATYPGVWGYYVGNPALYNDGAGFPEGAINGGDDVSFLIYGEMADQAYEPTGMLIGCTTAVWYDKKIVINPIDEKYLPKAEAVADVINTPTAEDFNALLQSLRDAGYMKS